MKTENYKFSNVPSGIANSAQRGSTDYPVFCCPEQNKNWNEWK